MWARSPNFLQLLKLVAGRLPGHGIDRQLKLQPGRTVQQDASETVGRPAFQRLVDIRLVCNIPTGRRGSTVADMTFGTRLGSQCDRQVAAAEARFLIGDPATR